MNASLLILTWLAPLLAAPFALRNSGRWMLPLASLPTLLTAVVVPAWDLLEPVLRFARLLWHWLGDFLSGRLQWTINFVKGTPRQRQWVIQCLVWSLSLEQTLSLWPVAGVLVLGIGGTLFVVLWTLP